MCVCYKRFIVSQQEHAPAGNPSGDDVGTEKKAILYAMHVYTCVSVAVCADFELEVENLESQ